MRNAHNILAGMVNRKGHSEDLGVDGKILE